MTLQDQFYNVGSQPGLLLDRVVCACLPGQNEGAAAVGLDAQDRRGVPAQGRAIDTAPGGGVPGVGRGVAGGGPRPLYRFGEVSQPPLALHLDFLVPMFLSVRKPGGAAPAR